MKMRKKKDVPERELLEVVFVLAANKADENV